VDYYYELLLMQVRCSTLAPNCISTSTTPTIRANMWSLLPLALLTLTTSARPAARHEEPKPVCIIGAGPAGLSAAGRLEKKGIKAMIFDSQAEVGGKCQAWYDEQ
jgi:NADPH-dependent glutamate synthase beta subunit-like oxidoreductase